MSKKIQRQLLQAIRKIDRPGTFSSSGILPPILPGLEVAGVGPVGLPLEAGLVEAIKRRARQAPYGKGTKTVVDTDVRRVWEIDADKVVLANPGWQTVLKEAISAAQSNLGLEDQKLEPHLYKLLLYEPGSFFLTHRDGEKLPRMVATLVIALPSAHKGGELLIRHEGREVIIDFGPKSAFETQFAAFYADCEHEIRPVTSGVRLALVYNLTLKKSKNTITAPSSSEHIAAVAGLLRQGRNQFEAASDIDDEESISKLAVILDHQYTQAGLTHDALKGIDRAKADVLFSAAREAGFDASLALVTYWETGSAEPSEDYYSGYGRRRSRGYEWDDDEDADEDEDEDEDSGEYEMEEVHETELTAEHFSDAEGHPLVYGQIPLEEEEVVSERPLNEGKPAKEEFEGYTGNAGMTLDRWYHRAAVLLWPTASRFDVLCEAGVQSAIGGLEQMVRHWRVAKAAEKDALKQSCLEFASRIINNWPERKFAFSTEDDDFDAFPDEDVETFRDFENEDFEDEDEDFKDEDLDDGEEDGTESPSEVRTPTRVSPTLLLSLLDELGDVSLMTTWIRRVLAIDVSIDPGQILGDVCTRHGWTTFEAPLFKVMENTNNESLERNARWLADWCLREDNDADRKHLCLRSAEKILLVLESWNPRRKERDWEARVVNRARLLPTLVQACLGLEASDLLERLVTYVLARPKEFDLTTVQVRALFSLEPWLMPNVKHTSTGLQRWLTAVVGELESRKAHPPKDPTTWKRESATGCTCDDCKELSRFLKDPKEQTLRLPLATPRRRHLHQIINRKKLDTTHKTERRGRPYTLVCTKTKASYERALKTHQVDLDNLTKIRELLKWHDGLPAKPESPAVRSKAPRRRRKP